MVSVRFGNGFELLACAQRRDQQTASWFLLSVGFIGLINEVERTFRRGRSLCQGGGQSPKRTCHIDIIVERHRSTLIDSGRDCLMVVGDLPKQLASGRGL